MLCDNQAFVKLQESKLDRDGARVGRQVKLDSRRDGGDGKVCPSQDHVTAQNGREIPPSLFC